MLPVAGRKALEILPCLFICFKRFFKALGHLNDLRNSCFLMQPEPFHSRLCHFPKPYHLLRPLYVGIGPKAVFSSGGESLHMLFMVNPFYLPINPAKADCLFNSS